MALESKDLGDGKYVWVAMGKFENPLISDITSVTVGVHIGKFGFVFPVA